MRTTFFVEALCFYFTVMYAAAFIYNPTQLPCQYLRCSLNSKDTYAAVGGTHFSYHC